MQYPVRIALAALSVLALLACDIPASSEPYSRSEPELLATYHPTPQVVVERMFEMAAARPGEVHFDIGSGDGRFVIHAARQYGIRSVGFEIDDRLIRRSRETIAELGLQDLAHIEERDLVSVDFAEADLITSYLTPEGYEKVVPLLAARMKPGSRLVAYKFELPGWTPDDVVRFLDEDPEIPEHVIYLYRR